MTEEARCKMLICGLNSAGKTTLLHYLKTGETLEESSPTRKFNIVDLAVMDLHMVVWDAPGQLDYRKTWADGLAKTHVLIFLIDTSDNDRFKEARKELESLLKDKGSEGIPLLLCFHKMDMEEAKKNFKDATSIFNPKKIKDRHVYWITTSLFSQEGLDDLKQMMHFLAVISEVRLNLLEVQAKYTLK